MRTLRDKVVVITGAAGGIGAALAHRLRAEGCRLVLVDRAAIDARPGVTTHAMDVGDADAWRALAAAVAQVHGAADVLVNNAGITIHGLFADQSGEDLDRIVDTNLRGVLHGCRVFLPQLASRGEGHIVNVSSLAGQVAFPYQSTYCATKFAVRGFSAALRMELSHRGVGVTTVMPGTVATRLLDTAASYDRSASQKMARLMMAHAARPERVAERIVRAIRRNEAEVSIGLDAWLTTTAHALSPSFVYGALGSALRLKARG